MSTRHFNKGTVRGRIIELKDRKTHSANKKPYGDCKVFCSSVEYGDVTVRLRFWGAQYPDLKQAYKDVPDAQFHLQGHVGLIDHRGEKLWAFNAFKYKLWVPVPEKDEARASFIIMGECRANFETFELQHVREDDRFPVDHLFKFPLPALESDASPPDLVTVYGHFKDAHNKFGGDGIIEPMIEDVTIKERRS